MDPSFHYFNPVTESGHATPLQVLAIFGAIVLTFVVVWWATKEEPC